MRIADEFHQRNDFSQESLDEFNGVGDICHILPGAFQLGDRNVLMFPYAPRPLLSGHRGPTDRNSHREYQPYYLEVLKAQYKALGKPENFRYHIHDGGHTIPPKTVIRFFRGQFGSFSSVGRHS